MYYAITCLDKPASEAIRMANRQAHLDYLKGFKDKVLIAGPLLADDGARMVGSLLVLDFPDRRAADDFAGGDPYNKAGLFASTVVRPWRKVLPAD